MWPAKMPWLQSNSSISCLCGLEVTQHTAVPDVPSSNPGSDKEFYVFVMFSCCVLFCGHKTIICLEILQC